MSQSNRTSHPERETRRLDCARSQACRNARSWVSNSIAFQVLLATLLLVVGASASFAGANETPGASRRPHSFSYFNPNAWEFGRRDVQIFQATVVNSQHYKQGAGYVDATKDLSPGGAGIWNFFTFCSDQKNDVMLVASHGVKNPAAATLVESYPRTVDGRAVRDSTLSHWNGVFDAGSFQAQNWRSAFVIVATQTFYSTYFQTPQAFCYWATCWSSHLSMTGSGEARAYLGYDRVVTNGKCWCDQRYILSRMDGQLGQSLRPLGKALAGVNGACADPANLVATGSLNTVLSPSVTGHAPTGVVCQGTPGFVSFDTTMDTRIPAAAVVVARGDAFLINHAWVGDDRITFDVVPTAPFPNILYDVIESQARGVADHARLDGNTRPPVNAKGPNRDDYIWTTPCPPEIWDVPVITQTPVYPLAIPAETDLFVTTPLFDLTNSGTSAIVTLDCDYLAEPLVQQVDFGTSSTALLSWIIPIPSDASPGDAADLIVDISHPNGDFHFEDTFLIDFPLGAELTEPTKLGAGTLSPLTLHVENLTEVPIEIEALSLSNIDGWPLILPPAPDPFLYPGDSRILQFLVDVPDEIPSPYDAQFELQIVVEDGTVFEYEFGVPVALPIQISVQESHGIVPGSQSGTVAVAVENLGQLPLELDWNVQDAFGFNVVAELPPILGPGETVLGQLFLQIPADPNLVGQSGILFLQAEAPGQPDVFEAVQLAYPIEPPVQVVDWFAPQVPYVGSDFDRPFDGQFLLENLSDQPVFAFPNIESGLPLNFPGDPIEILPHQVVEFPMQVILPVGLLSGPQELTLQLQTDLGSEEHLQPLMVFEPIQPDPIFRAVSGGIGESIDIQFVLENIKQDQPADGVFLITDSSGWLIQEGEILFNLLPGATDTVNVTVDVPTDVAVGDTTQVTLDVDFIYDTGEIARSSTELTFVAVEGETADVPEIVTVRVTTHIESVGPNPFRPATSVRFQLAQTTEARLTVHDASGRRVAGLADGLLEAGSHAVRWNGLNENGALSPAGVYFFRLETSEGRWSAKGVRMK